ncbi:MAG: hypothetical protein P1U46_00930 [Patescibacteria group bacterium]|nr:hypothetical protein [Patescibacteria group bacterium]
MISKSTKSHILTISSTFVTLEGDSLDICIIPDFHLNSTIAHIHSIILTTFQFDLYHISGIHKSSFISEITLSQPD